MPSVMRDSGLVTWPDEHLGLAVLFNIIQRKSDATDDP
jgi:hypothetical protein